MRVLINTIPLYGRGPGLRTYTAGFLRGLHASNADMEWHVILRPADAERLGLTDDHRFRAAPCSSLPRLSGIPGARFVWRNATDQLLFPILVGRYDVAHYLDSYGPLVTPRRTPLVLTVHDVLPLLGNRYLPAWAEAYLATLMRITIPRAGAIFADSEATAQHLTAKLGVAPERIAVAPSGIDERFRPATSIELQTAAARYGLASPYIVYVGSINPRKNVARLVRAFARMRREHDLPHHLVLAGGLGWQYDDTMAAIQETSLGAAVHLLGRVPDEDVPLLIGAADCLAYPSLNEGFGLPVIEAMACGTPVLTSAISPLMELAQGAALLVDPTSEEAIAAGLGRLLRDGELRATLREAGLRHAQQYTWAQVAQAAIEVYWRLARKRSV